MNEKPDWNDSFGRAQNGAAYLFGFAMCIFLASISGVLVGLFINTPIGIMVSIGVCAGLLRMTFKDWED